jgi:hypothetical protein
LFSNPFKYWRNKFHYLIYNVLANALGSVLSFELRHNNDLPVFSSEGGQQPIIHDNKMTVLIVFEGLNFPTSMAFLGQDDLIELGVGQLIGYSIII